jgi:hypothetical protein
LNARNANNNAQAKINARNAQVAQEQERQKIFQQQNDGALNNTLKTFDKDTRAKDFADLVTKREDAYAANAPAAQEFAAIGADAPQVVQQDKAKRVAEQLGKSKAEAKALARIGGTADQFQNNGLSINDTANKIGATNNLARGSLDVNRIEQTAAANRAGNRTSVFGDLLSAAGAAGTGAVAGGRFSAAPSANVAVNPALGDIGPFDNSLPWRNGAFPSPTWRNSPLW